MTSDERTEILERFKAARVAAGLPPLIDDERTLRMLAALMLASRIERRAADR